MKPIDVDLEDVDLHDTDNSELIASTASNTTLLQLEATNVEKALNDEERRKRKAARKAKREARKKKRRQQMHHQVTYQVVPKMEMMTSPTK